MSVSFFLVTFLIHQVSSTNSNVIDTARANKIQTPIPNENITQKNSTLNRQKILKDKANPRNSDNVFSGQKKKLADSAEITSQNRSAGDANLKKNEKSMIQASNFQKPKETEKQNDVTHQKIERKHQNENSENLKKNVDESKKQIQSILNQQAQELLNKQQSKENNQQNKEDNHQNKEDNHQNKEKLNTDNNSQVQMSPPPPTMTRVPPPELGEDEPPEGSLSDDYEKELIQRLIAKNNGHKGSKENQNQNKNKCTMKNAIEGYRGECICASGYIGDRPVSSRGCWKCEPQCHSQAVCVFPGRCLCEGGLSGDGINHCDPPKASLKSIASIHTYPKIPEIIEVSVYFDAPFDFVPFNGFCGFLKNENDDPVPQETLVNAQVYENRSLSCFLPQNYLNSFKFLTISFDGNNWSNKIEFSIPQMNMNMNSIGNKIPPLRTALVLPTTPKPTKVPPKPKMTINKNLLVISAILTAVLFFIVWMNSMSDYKRKKSDSGETIPLAVPVDKRTNKVMKEGMRKRGA